MNFEPARFFENLLQAENNLHIINNKFTLNQNEKGTDHCEVALTLVTLGNAYRVFEHPETQKNFVGAV